MNTKSNKTKQELVVVDQVAAATSKPQATKKSVAKTTSKHNPYSKYTRYQIRVWSDINHSLVEQFKPQPVTKQPTDVELIETAINQMFETLGDKVPTEEVSTYKDTWMQLISNTIEQVQANKQHILAANKGISKAQIARNIFEQERPNGLIRKVVIHRLINEAGLTQAGANTYLQNYRQREGLVIHK